MQRKINNTDQEQHTDSEQQQQQHTCACDSQREGSRSVNVRNGSRGAPSTQTKSVNVRSLRARVLEGELVLSSEVKSVGRNSAVCVATKCRIVISRAAVYASPRRLLNMNGGRLEDTATKRNTHNMLDKHTNEGKKEREKYDCGSALVKTTNTAYSQAPAI